MSPGTFRQAVVHTKELNTIVANAEPADASAIPPEGSPSASIQYNDTTIIRGAE